MGVFLTIIILALVVAVHEYGHYLAMRRSGVRVVQFAVGIGPTIFSWKLASGTMFRLNLFLIGGYAQPVMEGPESMETASRWGRFWIFVSGMLANVIAAFLAFAAVFYYRGKGIFFPPFTEPSGLSPSIQPLVAAFVDSFGLWFTILGQLFSMGMKDFAPGGGALAGPIGIVSMGDGVLAAAPPGIAPMIMVCGVLFALLNIAVAAFNLLPIPPLDGGRLVILGYEAVTGRENTSFARVLTAAGTLFMLALFLYVMLSDVITLFIRPG